MSLQLEGTSIKRKHLVPLARSFSHDREAFLQLLLDLCSKSTFGRIVRCPTYPIKIVTADLENRRRLFYDSVASNPFDVSCAFASLYEAAAERSLRKREGQYFTPPYVAEKAVTHLAPKAGEMLLDPGCGTGIFPITITKVLLDESQNPGSLGYLGIENDPLLALSAAISLDWIGAPSSWRILCANFVNIRHHDIEKIIGKERKVDAIISNPPFVRFHKLGERTQLATELDLQSFSGLHSYFISRSSRLVRKGRMIFITPIVMNGTRYGTLQLKQLKSKFSVENEVTYWDEGRHVWNSLASSEISLDMHTMIKRAWNLMIFRPIFESEAQPPILRGARSLRSRTVRLASFASVHRGISTGANSFFVMTDALATKTEMFKKPNHLKKVVPTKIRKLRLGVVFDDADWEHLREEGRPCWLLSLPRRKYGEDLSDEVKQYLRKGESLGIHLAPTCKSRVPWYSITIPSRIPDVFFTYVSRGFPTFSYNKARVYHLTNLLGVYLKTPSIYSDKAMQGLANLLNSEIRNWINRESAGRRYEGGLVKFEPGDLEKMPVTLSALRDLQDGIAPLNSAISERF